jgi:predicted RNA-binding protein YlxR (DUF448 family)
VGCGKTSTKREFARVVRLPGGEVTLDASGKLSGRGAYLCAQRACWEAALHKDRLGRALRTTLGNDAREQLMRYADGIEAATVGT